jgi:CBS domain-containing protein
MRVSDIMTPAAISEKPGDTLAAAARTMWEQQTGSLLVMESEELLGIITERDILKAVATGTDLEKTRVEEVMVRELVTIHPGATLREAASAMNEKWIRHLPVLDRGRLVGILSQRDLAGILGSALNEPEALEQLIDASELARERRLSRIEAGGWD